MVLIVCNTKLAKIVKKEQIALMLNDYKKFTHKKFNIYLEYC